MHASAYTYTYSKEIHWIWSLFSKNRVFFHQSYLKEKKKTVLSLFFSLLFSCFCCCCCCWPLLLYTFIYFIHYSYSYPSFWSLVVWLDPFHISFFCFSLCHDRWTITNQKNNVKLWFNFKVKTRSKKELLIWSYQ